MNPAGRTTSARRVLAALALTLAAPGRAAACAVCLGSAFGDRGYTWPYLGLILLPFAVGGAVLAALAWYAGWRPRDLAARAAALLRGTTPADPSPSTHTETT